MDLQCEFKEISLNVKNVKCSPPFNSLKFLSQQTSIVFPGFAFFSTFFKQSTVLKS